MSLINQVEYIKEITKVMLTTKAGVFWGYYVADDGYWRKWVHLNRN